MCLRSSADVSGPHLSLPLLACARTTFLSFSYHVPQLLPLVPRFSNSSAISFSSLSALSESESNSLAWLNQARLLLAWGLKPGRNITTQDTVVLQWRRERYNCSKNASQVRYTYNKQCITTTRTCGASTHHCISYSAPVGLSIGDSFHYSLRMRQRSMAHRDCSALC
ncbi:hypothetical protein BDR04DRAFT_784533 [Suillus decipiens]|nr:hypothetical protein BDR04DRAFT_784533 [Suillus decipiens]